MRWPRGIRSAGVACGIKRRRPDLGVLVADAPVAWAGTFTQNAAAAPCVHWARSHLGGSVRALVVNSGNANACTGPDGEAAVVRTARAAARGLSCDPDEVLVCSTGPIGVPLPIERIEARLPGALHALEEDADSFAGAIHTTDTTLKLSQAAADGAVVCGVAKGAAMLAPNMATMLAFIATDAALPRERLQESLSHSVDLSFNRICVDACESTNDSVFLLSTQEREVDARLFDGALGTTCRDLARQIARDAEGGTRLVHVEVYGAPDDRLALRLARAVASSTLWRAAVHGGDPNWGRVVAALGAAQRDLDPADVKVSLGSEAVFAGAPCGSLEAAVKVMTEDEFTVSVSVGDGQGSAEVLHSDLSPGYVNLNAFGRT